MARMSRSAYIRSTFGIVTLGLLQLRDQKTKGWKRPKNEFILKLGGKLNDTSLSVDSKPPFCG